MSSLDLATRCRRLVRKMVGDPMEAALLRLAKECKAEAGRPVPAALSDRSLLPAHSGCQ